jgi:hypothetical protein
LLCGKRANCNQNTQPGQSTKGRGCYVERGPIAIRILSQARAPRGGACTSLLQVFLSTNTVMIKVQQVPAQECSLAFRACLPVACAHVSRSPAPAHLLPVPACLPACLPAWAAWFRPQYHEFMTEKVVQRVKAMTGRQNGTPGASFCWTPCCCRCCGALFCK